MNKVKNTLQEYHTYLVSGYNLKNGGNPNEKEPFNRAASSESEPSRYHDNRHSTRTPNSNVNDTSHPNETKSGNNSAVYKPEHTWQQENRHPQQASNSNVNDTHFTKESKPEVVKSKSEAYKHSQGNRRMAQTSSSNMVATKEPKPVNKGVPSKSEDPRKSQDSKRSSSNMHNAHSPRGPLWMEVKMLEEARITEQKNEENIKRLEGELDARKTQETERIKKLEYELDMRKTQETERIKKLEYELDTRKTQETERIKKLEYELDTLKTKEKERNKKFEYDLGVLKAKESDMNLKIFEAERKLSDSEAARRKLGDDCQKKDDALTRAADKLKGYEKQLLELHQTKGDLPSLDIITGSYNLGGTNPESIQNSWQEIYKILRRTCYTTFKNLGHKKDESKAFSDCQALVMYTTLDEPVPRIETTLVVHKVFLALMPIFGLVSMNILNDQEQPPIMVESTFPWLEGRNSEISKDVLGVLPIPGSESFDPYNAFEILAAKNPHYCAYGDLWITSSRHVQAVLRDYGLDSSDIDVFIGNLVYAAIYAKFQMVAIGDSTVLPFVAGTLGDLQGYACSDYHLSKNDNLHEGLFDIKFDPEESKIQKGTLAFTMFPGVGYWNAQDGEWKVISKCMVATYEVSD